MANYENSGRVSSYETEKDSEYREDDGQAAATEAQKAKAGELAVDTDAMLDEIDDVLEENAEEFVASYVQKGGQ
jgi:ubiquitin-like protein Pup